MKKKFLILLMVVLAISCALTACFKGDKAPESIEIKAGTLKTEYNLNDTPDFSGVKVTVKYNDGSTEEVGADKLTFGTIDTATAGAKKLTVTFDKITVTVDVTVKGDTIDKDDSTYIITGALLPSSITSIDSAIQTFRNQTKQYYAVGDDNPYVLTLTLTVYDKATLTPITNVTSYTSASKVYLVEGTTETELTGDNLTAYVAIDETKNSFDFTDAAVGKVFRIETRPAKDFNESAIEKVTRSHTVQVVDGYNIYNAKELNLIFNDTDADLNGVKQVDVVSAFLAQNGIARPDHELAGVVLHGDIVLQREDVPAAYFIPADAGSAAGYLYDGLMVYRHMVTKAVPTFTIHGNYYTIDSKNLPRVPLIDEVYNKDGISNSALFMFSVDPLLTDTRNGDGYPTQAGVDVNAYQAYDHTAYTTNINNLSIRDNEPRSNMSNQEILDASKCGLLGIKTRFHVVNLNNIRVEAFMLSLLTDYDHQTVNINQSIFNNAWQNHIFASSKNILWERNGAADEAAANHVNPTINIIDSQVTQCGGPIIISQTNTEQNASKTSANIINIDDKSVVNTYISTGDAWFAAYPLAQTYANKIVAMNPIIAAASNNTAGFVNNTMTEGKDILNIVMIDMIAGNDLTPNPAVDLNSILSVNGNAVLNQKDMNPTAAYMIQQTGGQLPVLVTSDGGVFGINPEAADPSQMVVGTLTPECFSGQYITLYYLGMAITFEYFHTAA